MIESVVLKNTVLGTQIDINKSSGEYWLNEVDFGQVESNVHTFKFIDQIGETVYNTTLGPRQIQISGWVAAWDSNSVSRMKRALNHFVNPKHLLEAYANDKKIQFYSRTSVVYSPTYKDNNEYISKFLITGYCAYPLFTDANEHTVSVASTTPLLRFPLVIPKDTGLLMGVRQPTLIAKVDNTGDLPVGYTIEFIAKGTVVNPIITDIGSQMFIKLNKTMKSGESIIVDTREGFRRIRGVINGVESNYFKYRTYDSRWLTLESGINYIRYNADEGVSALEVTIKFEPGYLEVDT